MKAFAFPIKLLKTEANTGALPSYVHTDLQQQTQLQAPRHSLVGYRLQPRSPLCWALRLVFTNICAS